MYYALKTIHNFEGTLYLEGSMVLRTLLILKEQEKRRWRSSTETREGERRKWFEVSEYSVYGMNYVSSIYWDHSQLISEKLWEQVIHILDLVQKYLKLSTKIFQIVF